MPEPLPLVLDTHVWIWLINGSDNLRPECAAVLSEAASSGIIFIPAICLWEVAMLVAAGKIVTRKPVSVWTREALSAPGLEIAALSPEIAAESCTLPGHFHRDPADRLIVATARVEHAILLTRDARILKYGADGHVKVIEA